jgi:hypothetical protein
MKGGVMNVFVALAIGYVLGAKSGSKDLDKLGQAVKALSQTDEFAEVVSVSRAHVAGMLRQLAAIVDGGHPVPETGDLVSRVRRLVGDS